MERLSYAWRYVLARMPIFTFLSLLLGAATVVTFVAGRVLLHTLGFHTASKLMDVKDWWMSGVINQAAAAFVIIPIFAGIYGVVFRLFENDPEPLKGFSILQKRYIPAALFSLYVGLPTLLIRFVIRQAMPSFVGGVVASCLGVFIDAAAFLALPALVRFDLKPLDAVLYGLRRFGEKPLAFIGYYLGATILGLSGLLACGVGVIVTLSVMIVAPALLLGDASDAEQGADIPRTSSEPAHHPMD